MLTDPPCRPPGTADRRGEIRLDLRARARHVHPLPASTGIQRIGIGAESKQVGRFLNPRVGLGRARSTSSRGWPAMTPVFRTSHPAFAARAARKQTKFAMLPPLTSSPPQPAGYPMSSAIHRTVCASISVASGESLHAPTLRLIAAASRSPSDPDRRRARRDVTEEPRMAVEERMLEQQAGDFSEHLCRSLAGVGKHAFALERAPDFCNRLVPGHQPMRHRGQPVGQRIDEFMAECTKILRGHFDRRCPAIQCIELGAHPDEYPQDPPKRGCNIRILSAQSFEEIGFACATAIHETERAIKLLRSPDRLVVLVG